MSATCKNTKSCPKAALSGLPDFDYANRINRFEFFGDFKDRQNDEFCKWLMCDRYSTVGQRIRGWEAQEHRLRLQLDAETVRHPFTNVPRQGHQLRGRAAAVVHKGQRVRI